MKLDKIFTGELLWTLIFFTVDAITKAIFVHYQGDYIIGILNKQGAWGLPFPMGILIIVSIIAVFLCFGVYAKKLIPYWSFILLLSGALGNLFDRVVFGGVRDWINVQIIPVFNIADVLITIGVIVFLYSEFYQKKGKY